MIKSYLDGYYSHADIAHWVRFNTVVRHVKYLAEQAKFELTSHDFATDTTRVELFDFVVVASGHFSTPNVPYFAGFETFPGRILHAHDFREASEFAGKDVVLIGSSYSAEDIGSQVVFAAVLAFDSTSSNSSIQIGYLLTS